MRYRAIERCSLVNGTGPRTVLWTQGCLHGCKGCQNPDTHDCNLGDEWDDIAEELLFKYLSEKFISGVTFSGGDPLHPNNRDGIGELAIKIKDRFPNKSVWLYTGYTWNEILEMNLPWLNKVDVICEGRFILSQRNVEKMWVGSDNQNVVDVIKSLATGQMVKLCE